MLQYLSQLEVRLNQFNSENERLKEENQSLKRKLDLLVSEVNTTWYTTYPFYATWFILSDFKLRHALKSINQYYSSLKTVGKFFLEVLQFYTNFLYDLLLSAQPCEKY